MRYSSNFLHLNLWLFNVSLNFAFILKIMRCQYFKVLSYYFFFLEAEIFCMFIPQKGKQTFLAFWNEVFLFPIISVKSSSVTLCPLYHLSQDFVSPIINLNSVPVSKLIQSPQKRVHSDPLHAQHLGRLLLCWKENVDLSRVKGDLSIWEKF